MTNIYTLTAAWDALWLDTFGLDEEETGTPIDLTGYSAELEVAAARGGRLLHTFNAAPEIQHSGTGGVISLNTHVGGAGWPVALPIGKYWYRLQLVAAGKPWVLIEGPLSITA